MRLVPAASFIDLGACEGEGDTGQQMMTKKKSSREDNVLSQAQRGSV